MKKVILKFKSAVKHSDLRNLSIINNIEINQKNEKSFKTSCQIRNYNISAEGLGSSKRKSQQKAAEIALEKLSIMGKDK